MLWPLRRPIQFCADVAVLASAFFIAYSPTINLQLDTFFYETALTQVSFVVFVQISVLYLLGAYSIIWRYISIGDLRVFAYASAASGTILLALRFVLGFTPFTIWQVPMSVISISTVVGFGGVVGLRVLRRLLYEMGERNGSHTLKKAVKKKRTLLVGAGRTGATLAREIAGRADSEFELWGFIDDSEQTHGGRVSGFKVLGPTSEIARFVDEIGIEEVIIALDDARGREIRRVADICAETGVKARIVPSLNELAQGKVSISRLRELQIEDLLGREPIELDKENLAEWLAGKTVLVTGAGGSIGSELVRQIAIYNPLRILLVERAESALFEIGREFAARSDDYVPLLADVGDVARVRQIFEAFRPEIVFHAAAHKHVTLMEGNATEAVKNNAFATRLLGEVAGEFGAERFVLISTDKAVNPTSVMGASKRLAEIAVQDLNARFSTNFVAVRFGNVIGSAGSVVPIFRDQIRKGGPVTVTHPEMTRYFMTIPEACQLVLRAGSLGAGGEIFVLDMGRPIKILDLALDMIRLSGLTPYEDVEIVFTGVRKGEKLFEELEMTGEGLERTRHPKIFIGNIASVPADEVEQMFRVVRSAVEQNDEANLRELINRFLVDAAVEVVPIAAASHETEVHDKFFVRPASLGLADQ